MADPTCIELSIVGVAVIKLQSAILVCFSKIIPSAI